ncbi:MAG: Rrf2 family transcriptional regulator [Alphaproteobacteria bacterium]
MKLSRTVAYALQATLQLAQANSGSPVPCSQLAATGHMPERFLLQVLRSLVTHGILQSTRGVEGGYTLERKPEEITLLEVIEAIDGPMGSNVASNHDSLPSETLHRLQGVMRQLNDNMRRDLSAIKLADLIPHKAVVDAGAA